MCACVCVCMCVCLFVCECVCVHACLCMWYKITFITIHKTRKSTIHIYSYLLWFQDESGSPGLVAAVSVDGQMVWTEGYDINQFLILLLP